MTVLSVSAQSFEVKEPDDYPKAVLVAVSFAKATAWFRILCRASAIRRRDEPPHRRPRRPPSATKCQSGGTIRNFLLRIPANQSALMPEAVL